MFPAISFPHANPVPEDGVQGHKKMRMEGAPARTRMTPLKQVRTARGWGQQDRKPNRQVLQAAIQLSRAAAAAAFGLTTP